MDVLLLGVKEAAEASLIRVLKALGRCRVARATLWSNVPRDHTFGLIFVGAGAVEPAWGTFEGLLRREARGAVLVALPELDTTTFAGEWEDVVWPAEVRDDVFVRVVRLAHKLYEANRSLERWALRDPLTDLLNRRGLQQVLTRETHSRDRGKGPISVVLVDVDDFKQVNDTLGMTGGDNVLRAVADRIATSVRQQDAVARVGGDEFLVLLPGARTWEAVEVAERIRHAVEVMPEDVTVSLGVRRMADPVSSVDDLLLAAQQGLKTSKAHGKNRVHLGSSRGDSQASLVDAHSLPPGMPLHRFRDITLASTASRQAFATMRVVDVEPDAALQLAMQRAVQAAWDLHWFRQALRRGLPAGDALHVRLYPSTVSETSAQGILSKLPVELAPSQLVISLDEQFLSGDPGALVEAVGALRGHGVRFCLDVAEFGPSCLESLVVLRPERVLLAAEAVQEAARSRTRREAVDRFARVVRSLDLDLLADGVIDDATAKVVRGLRIDVVGRGSAAA